MTRRKISLLSLAAAILLAMTLFLSACSGTNPDYEKKIEELQKQISDLQQQAAAKDETNETLQSQLDELQQAIDGKDADIDSLQSQIDELRETIEDITTPYYTLTVQDPDGYVIVDLQKQYKAGEAIYVTTELIPDTAIGAYLDGVFFGLGAKSWEKIDSQYQFCRIYYFIMPEHDAILSFSPSDYLTEDGIPLTEAEQTEIKTVVYNEHKHTGLSYEYISLRCYGAFDGVYVLFLDGVWSHLDVVTSEVIAGVIFTYPNSIHMEVYCDGAFYTLSEAYENGILSYDDLLTTHDTYKACNGSTFAKDEIWPQDID